MRGAPFSSCLLAGWCALRLASAAPQHDLPLPPHRQFPETQEVRPDMPLQKDPDAFKYVSVYWFFNLGRPISVESKVTLWSCLAPVRQRASGGPPGHQASATASRTPRRSPGPSPGHRPRLSEITRKVTADRLALGLVVDACT